MPIKTPSKEFESLSVAEKSVVQQIKMATANNNSETESVGSSTSGSTSIPNGQRVYRWSKFVRNLYEMAIAPQNAAAVGFSEDGLCLEIRDPKSLSSEVLQNYFKHNNVSSFIRQLNNYGFKTVPIVMNASIAHCFAHDCFQRGRIDLLEGVTRKAGSDTSKLGEKLTVMKEKEGEIEERLVQLKRVNEQLRRQNAELEDENKRLKTNWMTIQDSLAKSRMFEAQASHQYAQQQQYRQVQQPMRHSSMVDNSQFNTDPNVLENFMMPSFPSLFPDDFQ